METNLKSHNERFSYNDWYYQENRTAVTANKNHCVTINKCVRAIDILMYNYDGRHTLIMK